MRLFPKQIGQECGFSVANAISKALASHGIEINKRNAVII
jgi:hypothetical protein